LVLARDWAEAWREELAPWLRAARFPARSLVVVPTIGQATGLKTLCVRDGIGLVGVEFVTPARLRARWAAGWHSLPPAMGRELLRLGLRHVLSRRLEQLPAESAVWALLTSLSTDVDTALADFDELLAAGLGPEAFPATPVGEVFAELVRWVEERGAGLAPLQARAVALAPPPLPLVAERAVFWAHDAECRAEWPALVALARRVGSVLAVLPEPEFRGRGLDETWIDAWERLLGIPPEPLPGGAAGPSGATGDLWLDRHVPRAEAIRAELHVAASPREEVAVVAEEVAHALAAGAESVAVVFPHAGCGEAELADQLAAAGVPCHHLLDTTGSRGAEVGLQHALLDFWARGARIEEFLELWTRLRALAQVPAPLGEMRSLAEWAFDRRPSRRLVDLVADFAEHTSPAARRAVELAGWLAPWPETLTLGEALKRFAAAATPLGLPEPEGWKALTALAARDSTSYAAPSVLDTLRSFLPRSQAGLRPAEQARVRVTLTTRRRAAGLPWSRVIFVRSNAGVWPRRRESSPWLPDAARRQLAATGAPGSDGWLPTADEAAWLERCGYAQLARNAAEGIVFTAVAREAADSETPAGPNAWVERVLLAQAPPGDAPWNIESAWRAAWREPAADGSAAQLPEAAAEIARWAQVWARRQNPAEPFDEWFYCADPSLMPRRLPARLIERAFADPVELWYEGVLGMRRAGWEPFLRARRKVIGLWVHRLLAQAFRGEATGDDLRPLPPQTEAADRLEAALVATRADCPAGADWDSLFLEIAAAARSLLAKVYALASGPWCATEWRLPVGTTLAAGEGTIELAGRIDLLLLNQRDWAGARVVVVDFKTGQDTRLSVPRMARRGESLQLGLYLAAARALGAISGVVQMLKPAGDGVDSLLGMQELDLAVGPPLARLQKQLARGCIGQLTPDRTDYIQGCLLPLACVPPRHDVLAAKWIATFGEDGADHAGDDAPEIADDPAD
jgi:hypothetical protein